MEGFLLLVAIVVVLMLALWKFNESANESQLPQTRNETYDNPRLGLTSPQTAAFCPKCNKARFPNHEKKCPTCGSVLLARRPDEPLPEPTTVQQAMPAKPITPKPSTSSRPEEERENIKYCMKCGHQLPGDANFCSKCGATQQLGIGSLTSTQSSMGDEAWEMLEIQVREKDFQFMKNMVASLFSPAPAFKRHSLMARITHPSGERFEEVGVFENYVTDEIESSIGRRGAIAQLDALSERLINEGWQPLPRGTWWYSYRFRRRLR